MLRAGSSRSSIVNNRVLRFGQEVASGNGVEVSGYAFTYGTHNPDTLAATTCFPLKIATRCSCRDWAMLSSGSLRPVRSA